MKIASKTPMHRIKYLLKAKGKFWSTLEGQLRMQEVPLTKLKKLQLIKLRKLLEYSYNNVDFYHKKFQEAGIRPVDITSLKDIEKIPITTKDELRANFPERIVSRNVDKNRKILDKISFKCGSQIGRS